LEEIKKSFANFVNDFFSRKNFFQPRADIPTTGKSVSECAPCAQKKEKILFKKNSSLPRNFPLAIFAVLVRDGESLPQNPLHNHAFVVVRADAG